MKKKIKVDGCPIAPTAINLTQAVGTFCCFLIIFVSKLRAIFPLAYLIVTNSTVNGVALNYAAANNFSYWKSIQVFIKNIILYKILEVILDMR
jgi:hypothetical protein